MAELEAVDIVRKYEVDGVHYGAIRNFYRFQRPKFPKLAPPTSAMGSVLLRQ